MIISSKEPPILTKLSSNGDDVIQRSLDYRTKLIIRAIAKIILLETLESLVVQAQANYQTRAN